MSLLEQVGPRESAVLRLRFGLDGEGPKTLREIGDRLGRNARFASIGNGVAAAAMGACGYFFSAHAVFFVAAALLVPTLLALSRIPTTDRPRCLAIAGSARNPNAASR